MNPQVGGAAADTCSQARAGSGSRNPENQVKKADPGGCAAPRVQSGDGPWVQSGDGPLTETKVFAVDICFVMMMMTFFFF